MTIQMLKSAILTLNTNMHTRTLNFKYIFSLSEHNLYVFARMHLFKLNFMYICLTNLLISQCIQMQFCMQFMLRNFF